MTHTILKCTQTLLLYQYADDTPLVSYGTNIKNITKTTAEIDFDKMCIWYHDKAIFLNNKKKISTQQNENVMLTNLPHAHTLHKNNVNCNLSFRTICTAMYDKPLLN